MCVSRQMAPLLVRIVEPSESKCRRCSHGGTLSCGTAVRSWSREPCADIGCRCIAENPVPLETDIVKLVEIVSTALVIGALCVALPGCDQPKGPAENAGAKIDNTVQGAGQKVEKAGDSIQDATTPGKN